MRTTIRLDDELLREAKSVAAKSGKPLNRLIEESLRESLSRHQAAGRRKRVVLHTFKGNGVRPGVDINCYGALIDLMDRWDATH